MRTEAEVRRYRELVRDGSQDEDATFRKRKNILTAKNKGGKCFNASFKDGKPSCCEFYEPM